MPFRSRKQRNFLRWKHPEIYKRWVREHGTKIVKKKRKRRALQRRRER